MIHKDCHGNYTIRVFGDLIVVRTFGSWNLEGAQNYAADAGRVRDEIGGRCFISLIDLREWELATPEAIEFLSRRRSDRPAMRDAGGLREIQLGSPEGIALMVSRNQVDRSSAGIAYVNDVNEAIELLRGVDIEFDAAEVTKFLAGSGCEDQDL